MPKNRAGHRIRRPWTKARWAVALAVIALVVWGFVQIVQPADPRVTPAADAEVREEPTQMEPLGPPAGDVEPLPAAAPAADTAAGGADRAPPTSGGED